VLAVRSGEVDVLELTAVVPGELADFNEVPRREMSGFLQRLPFSLSSAERFTYDPGSPSGQG
jgi:hypothetical protein